MATRLEQVTTLFQSVVSTEVPGIYYALNQLSFNIIIARIVKNPYGTGFQPQGFDSQAARGWRDAIAISVGLTEFQRCTQFKGVTSSQVERIIQYIAESRATLKSDFVLVRGFKTRTQREANMVSASVVHGNVYTCKELKEVLRRDIHSTHDHAWIQYEDGNTGYIFDSFQAAHLYLGGTIVNNQEYDEFGVKL